MELRDYQKRQLNYLITKDNTDEVVALESPTGSGKSFVILSYIKHYFEKNKNQTVVITTGSNNLVFDFAKSAKDFGLDPIIYVGASMLTCYELTDWDDNEIGDYPHITDKHNGDRIQIFSNNKDELCSTENNKRRVLNEETGKYKQCETCKKCKRPHLIEVKKELNSIGNKLIITNHQAYLTHVFADKPHYYPDLVIIDEAHMFGTFYSNWLNTDIDSTDIRIIKKALKGLPQELLFNTFLERGEPLPTQLLQRIIELIKLNNNDNTYKKEYIYQLCNRLSRFSFSDKDREDIYFKISPSLMSRIQLWHKFNINSANIKYRLFSATIDRFTRIMFGMDPDDYENNFYREMNLNLIDYSKSDAFIYKLNNFENGIYEFIEFCEKQNYKSGLILSTTIENVNNIKEAEYIGKYKVFTKINEFRDFDDYKVLVGSRAMFQGIDIPEISFVAINKIPFETYDEEFKKRVAYLKKYADIDPWIDYSIPLVRNSLIQSTGRLWRGPDNYGSIAIFDGRLVGRFKYLQDTITKVRNGIKLNIVGDDPEEMNSEGFDEIITNKESKW